MIFKAAHRLRDQHVFMWHSQEILIVFNTLTLKLIFSKTKTFFKKLEYHILVETTRIENATFLYKTVLSESNVKTNGMGDTTKTYHKERSFASNYFSFPKNLYQFKNLVQRGDLITTQISIFILFESVGVLIWGCFFPVGILKN